MVGRKLFKTRICILYRKGQCHRQNCSFAHGDAELRRYNASSSFNGRRDYRASADLREKLGRQRSPPRRNSPERDLLPSHRNTSPRLGKKSDWGQRKRQKFDGENDFSGSLRSSDGAERQPRERKASSSDIKDIHDEQLKQVQSEIDLLEDQKQQLQIYLEESIQEADSLNSKIEELEMQLSAEKEECKRISSKLRRFVKANNRHARIQEELKRLQARLQRLGDQLGSDARAAASEEDININILSDEENFGNLLMSPKTHKVSPRKNEILGMSIQKDQYKASPDKKRMRAHTVEADERSRQASYAAGEWVGSGNMRSERHSRWDPHLAETKNTEDMRADAIGISNTRSFVNDGKSIRRKSSFNSAPAGDEFKDAKSSKVAANTVDEVILNEKLEAKEISSIRIDGGSTHDNTTSLPFPLPPPPPPPPPPVAPTAHLQKGKEETLDVVNDDDNDEDEDEDEMLDVDIV